MRMIMLQKRSVRTYDIAQKSRLDFCKSNRL